MARRRKLIAVIFLLAVGVSCVLWLWLGRRDPLRRYEEGLSAVGIGDTRTAIREANLLLKTAGFESRGHMIRGRAFLQAQKYVAAAVEFRSAAADPEMQAEAYTRCGETFYRMRQYVDAEQMLLLALEMDADNSDARRWLASTYYDLGSMSLALAQLRIVAERNPDDGRPSRLSGRIQKDFHHYGEAIDAYREALRRTLPESEREAATAELAECLVQQLQYSEALQILQDVKPTARILGLQAACYAATGEPAMAIAKAEESLTIDPDLVSAILTRASLELEVGQAESVIELLENAAQRHPGNFEILFQLVKALRLAGRNTEADSKAVRLEELETLVDEFARLNSEAFSDLADANLRFRLGQLAQQLDRPELARVWLEAALAIEPNLVPAKNLLNQLDQSP